MSTTVTWTQDVGGNYEISSPEHLLQLMHGGALFTDAGISPTDYYNDNYVQTIDIDLASHAANINPVAGTFAGEYDGQGFSISNWSYASDGVTFLRVGLFSNVQPLGSLKNMVLDGVWNASGGNDTGFLSAAIQTSSTVYNITTNFASGTTITGNSSTGCIFGFSNDTFIHNITVGGVIDVMEGSGETGGVVGYGTGNGNQQWSHIRNIATFTTGIKSTGSRVGGIAGRCVMPVSHVMNAMTGDVIGVGGNAGGIFGLVSSNPLEDIVLSMRGNITTDPAYKATGIAIAPSGTNTTISRVMNYMTGNVQYGLFADIGSDNIDKSVVAMNGTTEYAAIEATTGTSEILLDTTYGIVSQFSNNTVTTMDLSSFYGISSQGLPFISFLYTDPDGNTIDWPFVFGNTFLITLVPRPISLNVSFSAVDGTMGYKLTIEPVGGSLRIVSEGFTEPDIKVNSLVPETSYTVRLYNTDDGVIYTLLVEDTTTTPVLIADNFDIIDYETEDGPGYYDITDQSSDNLDEFLNELFMTGDILVTSTYGGSTRTSVFVNDADSISIVGVGSVITPFNESLGSSQTTSIVLGDTTSVPISYDETNGSVTVGGEVLFDSDYNIIDGRKMTMKTTN